jgi:hypothetical protein
MNTDLEKNNNAASGIARRSFMKLGGVSVFSLLTLNAKKLFAAENQWNDPGAVTYDKNIPWYWNDKGFPVQKTVKVNKLSEGIISAEVDKQWKQFKIIELEQEFRNFESTSMANVYNKLLEGSMVFGGAYCPGIISQGGIPRGDSQFNLNAACKFMFPCPKEDQIQEIIDGLKQRATDPVARRTWFRDQFLNQDVWNWSRFVGRDETVVPPGVEKPDTDYRETHTFRNLMANPLAVLLFISNIDVQSFELRTIAHYVSQDDETADPYEQKIAEFINTYANVSHGQNNKFPAIIFYTVEEFNNSMMGGKEGVRVAGVKDSIKNLYAKMPWNKKSTSVG